MAHGSVITVRNGENELVRGLKRQSSVVMAIIFKEFKVRMRTSKFGLLYLIIEPMVMIVMLATLWYLFRKQEVDGLNVLIYLPLGVAPFLIFTRSIGTVPSAVHRNRGLLDYPQVKPIDCVIAVYIFEITLSLLASTLALLLIWWVAGIAPSFPRPLEAIGVLLALLIGAFGCALLLSVYGTFYENLPRTIGMLRRPLILMSGVIFPVTALPPAIQWYLSWNPLLQFIEGIRYFAAGHPVFMYWDLAYASVLSVAVFGIGYIAYYANRYRLVQSR